MKEDIIQRPQKQKENDHKLLLDKLAKDKRRATKFNQNKIMLNKSGNVFPVELIRVALKVNKEETAVGYFKKVVNDTDVSYEYVH